MKKKTINKMLAVAAFGLITASASIDVNAAEDDNIVGTADNDETAESDGAESTKDNGTDAAGYENPQAADAANTASAENINADATENEEAEYTDFAENIDTAITEDAGSEPADPTEIDSPVSTEPTENNGSDTSETDSSASTEPTENNGSDTSEIDSSVSTDPADNIDSDTSEIENSESTDSMATPDDTDNSSENREPSNFEEAKENLEKAEQEESAAKDKVNNAQYEADQAQADLDRATQEAEAAENELKQAEEERDQAQIDKDNADQAVSDSDEGLKQAESNLNDKLTENEVDRDAFTETREELESKKEDVAQAQETVDHAQEEYVAKEQEASEAQAKVDEAQKAVDEARAEKDKADEQVANASMDVTNAQISLEEAQNQTEEDAVNAAKANLDTAQSALNDIKEQISKGSLGFFEEMAATEDDADSTASQAVKVLTSTEDVRVNKGEGLPSWEEFRAYTNIGTATDATSLDNMKRAFDFIRECNSLRTNDELRPSNNNLLVTDYLMAIAQMNANWAQDSNGTHNSHSRIFNVGENLAWYPGSLDPFDGWYTKEKENYKNNPEWANNTGHYMNITNSSYTVTGLGICLPDDTSVNRWLTYAQEFDGTIYNNTGKSYTINEYEARFNNYYNKVTAQLTAAQEAYDKAKAAYEKALTDASSLGQLIKDDIAAKQKNLDNAREALSNAQRLSDEKNTILENAKSAKNTADSKLMFVQTALSESYGKLTEAKASLEQAQKAYDEALNSAEEVFGSDIMNAYKQFTDASDVYHAAVAAQEKATAKLDEAQTALINATIKKNAADTNVQEREAVLADRNAALNTAKKEYTLAVANLAIAQDDYNRLKPAAPSYSYGSSGSNSINSAIAHNDFISMNVSADGSVQTVRFAKDCSFKYFINKFENILKENPSGSITIDCSETHWFSINTKLLNAIKERSDREFTVIFTYNGKKYTFTIPANYDLSQLNDSNGWYGFMYLYMIFGGHEITS